MKKNFFSILLTITSILSSFSIHAFASEESTFISDTDIILKMANIYMAEKHIAFKKNVFSMTIHKANDTLTIFSKNNKIEEEYGLPLIEYLKENHADPDKLIPIHYEDNSNEYSIELPEYTLGDFNDDSAVTAEDAQLALAAYAEKCAGKAPEWTEVQKAAYDPDCDDELTAADAQFILQYYVSNTVAGIPTTWVDIVVFGK